MGAWIKRIIAVLQIGGGFMGVILCSEALMNSEKDPIYIAINSVFGFLYLLGIIAGVSLLESGSLGFLLSKIYQFLQIPVMASPYFQYSFVSGLVGIIYWDSNIFSGSFEFGSHSLFIFRPEVSWNVGINIVAACFFIYFMFIKRQTSKQALNKSKQIEISDANRSPVYTRKSNQFLYASADSKN